MPVVGVFVPAKNEEEMLGETLDSLLSQTLKPARIVVVDDASTDRTGEIARSKGVDVVRFPLKHPSWVGRPELSLVFNVGVAALEKLLPNMDYMMVIGADTILSPRYLEVIVSYMEENPKIVVASGRIEGEPMPTIPRGSGRVFSYNFWRRYVRRFPYCYSWESYPVYKALAKGYDVKVLGGVVMRVKRPTREYKSTYGYAMRELGYHPLYAIGKVAIATLRSPRIGLKILYTYLTSPVSNIDPEITAWIRGYQEAILRRIITNPSIVFKRLAGK